MAFDWNEYLNLANVLRQTKEEAYQRSAISRGYYSAFNIAQLYLAAKKQRIQGDDHDALWSHIGKISGNIEIMSLGKRVKLLRQRADYRCDFPNIEAELGVAMQNSSRLIYLIKQLDTTPI